MSEKLADLNVEQFWADEDEAQKDNCFNPNSSQVALGIRMSHECVFAELGVPGNPWGENPPEVMRDYTRRYNDKAEKIVGRRLISQEYPSKASRFPYVKRIGEIFGGEYYYKDEVEWLEGTVKTASDLSKILDHVEKMDAAALERFIVPEDWDKKVKRVFDETGFRPEPWFFSGHHVRGPVTLAMSICGVENFIFMCYDEPEVCERFSRVLGDAVLARAQIIDKLCGYTAENYPHGFSFADDNCCLMTGDMYEMFGYPVLDKLFSYYSPNEGDARYQHSDSDMGHLIPILGRLNFTGVNFGPTVTFDDIRPHMPKARVDGCIAPFTFMRNDREELIAQCKRDCEMAVKSGTRGLNLATAGSINNGSSLESMRLVMQCIQTFGRYR